MKPGAQREVGSAVGAADPSYIEIYQLDLRSPETARDLADEAKKLAH